MPPEMIFLAKFIGPVGFSILATVYVMVKVLGFQKGGPSKEELTIAANTQSTETKLFINSQKLINERLQKDIDRAQNELTDLRRKWDIHIQESITIRQQIFDGIKDVKSELKVVIGILQDKVKTTQGHVDDVKHKVNRLEESIARTG